MKVGLLKSTNKAYEKRIPIHPKHFELIEPELRSHLVIENGYSADFGVEDNFYLEKYGIKSEPRNTLIQSAECNLLVRPTLQDLQVMKPEAVSVGWFHCVQNSDVTQEASNRKLTLVCMEGLFDDEGHYLFTENSRITGQQAIKYALGISNRSNDQKAVVIGHGSAGIAAIHELITLGFTDITCLSRRHPTEIKNAITGVKYIQIQYGHPILDLLKDKQVIVNATAQDIRKPAIFVHTNEISQLHDGTLIIDISCDRRMGFEFSQITTLDAPIIEYDFMSYCAIDHLPTLEYDTASKAISESLLIVLPSLFKYLKDSAITPMIERSIQIRNGQVLNPDITYFQQHFL